MRRLLLALLWPLIALVLGACTDAPNGPELATGGATVLGAGGTAGIGGGTAGSTAPAEGGAAGMAEAASDAGSAGQAELYPEAGAAGELEQGGAAGAPNSPVAGGTGGQAGSGGASGSAGVAGQAAGAGGAAPRGLWGACDPTLIYACDRPSDSCMSYQDRIDLAPRPICQIACMGPPGIALCAEAGGVCYGGPIPGCVPHNPLPAP